MTSNRHDAIRTQSVCLSRRSMLGACLIASFGGSILLTGCGEDAAKKTAAAPAGAPAAGAAAATNIAKKIGIVQLITHEALDDAVRGFRERLTELGYALDGAAGKDGKAATIDLQNAHGDTATLQAIVSRFVSNDCDLIYAVSTPALQAAARATRTIPIVATAVTSFERAKVVKSDAKPGGNVTGVSNAGPIDKQLELLLSMLPQDAAPAVGVLYTASEDNSLVQVERLRAAAEKKGVKLVETAVASVNDIQQAVTSLSGKVAGLWFPTDNVLAAGTSILAKAAKDAKIPTIPGDEALIRGGCLATIAVDYYTLGRMSGTMAADILEGKSKPADMAIQTQDAQKPLINLATAKAIGLKIPEDILKNAAVIEK